MKIRLLSSIIVFAAISIAGCSGGDGPTGTVTGKITFEGQPVTEGRVSFVSAQGRGATGMLGSEGAYTLKTIAGANIPIGEYQVSVQPPPPEARDPADTAATVAPARGEMLKGAPGDPVVKEYPNIPKQYRDPATSKWKATVVEGANDFDFEMVR